MGSVAFYNSNFYKVYKTYKSPIADDGSGSAIRTYWLSEEEITELKRIAEKGSGRAAFRLWEYYKYREQENGIYWLELGAKNGYFKAQRDLLSVLRDEQKAEKGLYWANKFYHESSDSEWKEDIKGRIESFERLQIQQTFLTAALDSTASLRQKIEADLQRNGKVAKITHQTLTPDSPLYPALKDHVSPDQDFLHLEENGTLSLYAQKTDTVLTLWPPRLIPWENRWTCGTRPESLTPKSCAPTNARKVFLTEAFDASVSLRAQVEAELRQHEQSTKKPPEALDIGMEKIAAQKLPIRPEYHLLTNDTYPNYRLSIYRNGPGASVGINAVSYPATALFLEAHPLGDGKYSWTCKAYDHKDLTPDACAALGADAPNANHAAAR